MVDRTIRISVNTSGAVPELNTLERELKQVQTASNKVDRQNKILSRSFKETGDTVKRISAINPKFADGRLSRENEKISRSLDSMNRSAKGAERSVEQLDRDLRRSGSNARTATRRYDRLSTELKEISTNASVAGVSLGTLGKIGGSIIIFDKIIQGIGDVRREISELEPITKTLRQFSTDLGDTQDFLFETSERLGQSYKGLASSYSGLLLQFRSGTITLEESKQLLEGFAAASAITGASTDQVDRAMVGLTQSLTSGTVQVDEFKQIVENMPVLLQAMATGLGTTTAEVRRMVKSGELGSRDLVEALTSGSAEIVSDAEAAANGVTAAWNRAGNSYTDLIQTITGPVASAEIGVATAISNALKNIDSAIENTQRVWERFTGALSDPTGGERVGAFAREVALGATLAQDDLEKLDRIVKQLDVDLANLRGDNGSAPQALANFRIEGDLDEGIAEITAIRDLANRLRSEQKEAIRISVLTDGFDEAADKIQTQADNLLDDLFNNSKLDELQNKLASAIDLRDRGGLTAAEFNKVEDALNALISKEKENSAQAREVAQANKDRASSLKEYQDLIGSFNPNFQAQFEYERTVQKLAEAQKNGAIVAAEYESAIADLDQALEREFIDNRIVKERELRDTLAQGVDNSAIDSYSDSMLLLNRALEDTPDKAEQIQQAIHRLNASFLETQSTDIQGIIDRFNAGPSEPAEALVATQSNESEELQQALDARRQLLLAYKETENADIAQANAELIQLDADRIDAVAQLEANHTEQRIEQSQKFNQAFIRESQSESEFRRDAAVRAGMSVEQAEAAHQERLAVIREFAFDAESLKRQYDAGQLAATEYHARREALESEHQERLAGIQKSFSLSQYDREIEVANGLFDIYEQSLGRKSGRALNEAREARRRADDATGTEKAALEEQAQVAEAAAKRRFDKEKKAGIAQARIQQGLAVVKAWTSGATIYDQIANAAVAFVGTEKVIQDLKSQQFNGGASLSGGGGSNASSGGGGSGNDNPNNQDFSNAGQVTHVTNIYTADDLINKDKFAEMTRQASIDDQDNDRASYRVAGTGQKVEKVLNG